MSFLKLPENSQGRDFAVGDLHGRYADLQEAMHLVDFDPLKDRIISCGDLIDRGPDSPALVALLDQPWFFAVQGNHEQLFLENFSGFVGLKEGEAPQSELAENYITRVGGRWVVKTPEKELYRIKDRLEQLPLVIEVTHQGQRFVFTHAELPGGGKLAASDFNADLNRLEQDRELILWSRAKAHQVALDSLEHRVEGVDYAFFGHARATPLTAQGYFFRFANRVYIEASFVPASRLLVELSQVDKLPEYPPVQLERLAQDLPKPANPYSFVVDLPSGEKLHAQLETHKTLASGTRVKLPADSLEPLAYRQNLPADTQDLPSVGDLLEVAAKKKPWKPGGELRVVSSADGFELQLIDAKIKSHPDSSEAAFIAASNIRTLNLLRYSDTTTSAWRARAVAAGLDGRKLIAITESIHLMRAQDAWLLEVLASLAPLVLSGKRLVLDQRFASWIVSLERQGTQAGWLPVVEGESTEIQSLPQDIKSHADGLLLLCPQAFSPRSWS